MEKDTEKLDSWKWTPVAWVSYEKTVAGSNQEVR